MADTLLQDLPAITTPASADLLYIADSTDSYESSKITKANLVAGLATSGANSDITSLSGLTTPLSVAQGGTGLATLTSGSVLVGNGTGAVTLVATTGSSSFVRATSPTLVTPVLGVATATSINKVTITAPATSSTLTVDDGVTFRVTSGGNLALGGKTATFSNTLTLAGTDSTTMTFPTTTATIARTDAAQTFTGTQTFSQIITTNNAITASGNAATVPITSRINTVTNNSAATLTITMTTTSAVDGQLSEVRIYDASAVAQTITWVNTENSTVTAPTTSNGSTTLPLSVVFQYNSATSKWRCLASA